MQDIIVKYLTGLREGASRFERRMYRKYGGVTSVSKTIEYDLKHGVTKNEVISFLVTVKTEASFSELRAVDGFYDKMYKLEVSLGRIELKPTAALFSDGYLY